MAASTVVNVARKSTSFLPTPLLAKAFLIPFEPCGSRDTDDSAQEVSARPREKPDRGAPPILEAHRL